MSSMMHSDPDLKPSSLLMFLKFQICLNGRKKYYIAIFENQEKIIFYNYLDFTLLLCFSCFPFQIPISHEHNIFYVVIAGNLVYGFIISRP